MPLTLLPPKQSVPQLSLVPAVDSQRAKPALIDSSGNQIELPEEVVDLLEFVVNAWQQGRGITVSIKSETLTTQEAANLIGCSRQHVVTLMNAGILPGRKIGTHRRLSLDDVLHFIQVKGKRTDEPLNERNGDRATACTASTELPA